MATRCLPWRFMSAVSLVRAATTQAPAGARPARAPDGVPDEPEHRRPQTDEQGSSLRVAALVLTDRLGADPQHDAERDGSQRGAVAAAADRAGVVARRAGHTRESEARGGRLASLRPR